MGLPVDEQEDEEDGDGGTDETETQAFLNSIHGEVMAMVKGKIKGKRLARRGTASTRVLLRPSGEAGIRLRVAVRQAYFRPRSNCPM